MVTIEILKIEEKTQYEKCISEKLLTTKLKVHNYEAEYSFQNVETGEFLGVAKKLRYKNSFSHVWGFYSTNECDRELFTSYTLKGLKGMISLYQID